jgi:branched-subunit amino acid aminotransferase/4-amino-4-deoxychorismate lyase
MAEVAARAATPRARLRVLRWRDDDRARTLLTVSPEPPPPREIVLGVCPERRPRDADERRHKRIDAPDLDRARRRSAADGRFDDLVLDDRGIVLEGARTSVSWRVGRTLHTPAATLPILPGTRRAWLMEAALRAGLAAVESEAPLDVLRAADEILVTNAIVGVRRRARLSP